MAFSKIAQTLYTLLVLLLAGSAAAQVNVDSLTKVFQERLNNKTKIQFGKNKEAGHSYKMRGFSFYAEQYGRGTPLLFIHGNGGSIADFTYQIEYFKDNYHVIAADNRSHGRSTDAGDSLTYEMMADDYAALLDSLHLDSVCVVGWSDGGIIGILLSQRHPEKVKKLVPVGANLQPDTNAVYQEIWDMVQPPFRELKAKATLNPMEKTALKLLRLLNEQPHIDPQSLKKIKIPVLVVSGDNDLIRPEHSLVIYRNLPKAYLWIVPGSGHSVPVFYKIEFNATVERFLQSPYRPFPGEQKFR